MKKQALTLAIAAALSAPSALAAQDTSGMRYTSASEGFYASIRVRYDSGATEQAKGGFENSSSRIGVRGTNDLGNGLEGFYRYEWEVDPVNTDRGQSQDRTRLGFVGLRGAFGQVQVGTFWTQDYNWTHGSTDVANKHSGNLNYTDDRPGRQSKAIEYTTPDLNGFQGALRVNMNASSYTAAKAASCGGGLSLNNDEDGCATAGGLTQGQADSYFTAATPAKKDNNALDAWNLAGTYSVQGFTVAGAYGVRPDAIEGVSATTGFGNDGNAGGTDNVVTTEKKDDAKSWTVRLAYSQDNWYATGWYGATNAQSATAHSLGADGTAGGDDANADVVGVIHDEDVTNLSMAAGISLDKVNLYALWEKQDNIKGVKGVADTFSTVGVQYNLGSNSRVWIEYAMRDKDSDKMKDGAPNTDRADDSFNIGLQHDF